MAEKKELLELKQVVNLCAMIGLEVDDSALHSLGADDPPDVEIILDGRSIGVECTSYQSTKNKKEINQRYQHSERRDQFFQYLESINFYEETGYRLVNLSLLSEDWFDIVPPMSNFNVIASEILELLKGRKDLWKKSRELMITRAEILQSSFINLEKFVDNVEISTLDQHGCPHFHPPFSVDFKDENIIRIIKGKHDRISRKKADSPEKIGKYDELWLLVHEGEFESLMTSSNVLKDYVPSANVWDAISRSPFHHVYIAALGKVFKLREARSPETF